MAGASVGGAERGREAEQNARGSGSRADCAVLTRAGPMQGARAVECDRGTLSARRERVEGVKFSTLQWLMGVITGICAIMLGYVVRMRRQVRMMLMRVTVLGGC